MLVLTRNIEQSIIINGDTKVKILAIRGSQVKLGVVAPIDVPVDHEEIHNRKQEEQNGNK